METSLSRTMWLNRGWGEVETTPANIWFTLNTLNQQIKPCGAVKGGGNLYLNNRRSTLTRLNKQVNKYKHLQITGFWICRHCLTSCTVSSSHLRSTEINHLSLTLNLLFGISVLSPVVANKNNILLYSPIKRKTQIQVNISNKVFINEIKARVVI